LKGIGGQELNGPALFVGVIVWVVIMSTLGKPDMGSAGDAVVMGLSGIGVLVPAWIGASLFAMFFQKK
jgi:hypothetical protein